MANPVSASTPPGAPAHPADAGPQELQRLAALAFSNPGHAYDPSGNRHLAFVPADGLQLDLDDPEQRRFAGYELLGLIGAGGTGVVYRARQLPIDREVALKLLAAGPWASRDFIARFEREACNAARMEHPNIVTVYEVGCFEDIHFYSMRLVHGASLATRLQRGEHFLPARAVTVMRAVTDAVAYAHGLGVLHLDLKPANVLVDDDGVPHVADFGMARWLGDAAAIDNDEVSGTPAYMAPEQAVIRAQRLSAATDIWALGVMLYELVARRQPFRADTAAATLDLVMGAAAREPSRFAPGLSADLEAIIRKCLYKDPSQRYGDARALADDLSRFLDGRPVSARPPGALRRCLDWARRPWAGARPPPA